MEKYNPTYFNPEGKNMLEVLSLSEERGEILGEAVFNALQAESEIAEETGKFNVVNLMKDALTLVETEQEAAFVFFSAGVGKGQISQPDPMIKMLKKLNEMARNLDDQD